MIFKRLNLRKYWFQFSFQRLNFSIFSLLLLLDFSIEKCYFPSIQWSSEWSKLTEFCCSWPAWIINPIFRQQYLLNFSFNASLENSLHDAESLFLESWISLVHRNWKTDSLKVAKFFYFWFILIFQHDPLEKNHWNSLLLCEMTMTSFWKVFTGSTFWLCPVDWNVDRLDMQKGSVIVFRLAIYTLNNP